MSAGAHVRYWVVARPALTRRFTDRNGRSRYGDLPVLTERYFAFLPITPALAVVCGKEGAVEASYRLWHSVSFGGVEWIFEGMPPTLAGDTLHGAAPFVMLSPHEQAGDVAIDLELKITATTKAKVEGVSLVFSRTSMDDCFALECSPDGRVTLWREGQRRRELAVADRKLDFGAKGVIVSLRTTGRKVVVTANGQPLLAWSSETAIGPGRYGLESSINTPPFSVRAITRVGSVCPLGKWSARVWKARRWYATASALEIASLAPSVACTARK